MNGVEYRMCISSNLGGSMVGINASTMPEEDKITGRGW